MTVAKLSEPKKSARGSLFTDLKGSMELLADRDPEEARKLLDPVLERMMAGGREAVCGAGATRGTSAEGPQERGRLAVTKTTRTIGVRR